MGHRLENGLDVRRVRVPLGVVAVVYEARPNVTVDCSALCLKSGNAIVLRGSSTAAHSNAVLAQVAAGAVQWAGIPDGAISIVSGGDRDELRQLATQDDVVDLIIPRGGEGLKKALKEHATVPVLYAAAGVCHVLVDASADLDDAVAITLNAKVQRPSVCNAIETLLVHSDVAAEFLPRALHELRESGVELRVDARTRTLAGDIGDSLAEATEEDWSTEYHALILSVKVVDSLEEGIEHVNRYGTGHSEAIVTGSTRSAQAFTDRRRRRGGVRERVHALHRRRRVRHGRRDRQLDSEAARARSDRAARAHHLQVRGRRLRAGPRVAGLRVGILGGAFNPPHLGHLVCAQEALVQLELDRVLFVPVGEAPHREHRGRPGRRGAARDGRAGDGGRRALHQRRGSSSTARGRRTPWTRSKQLRKESPDDELFLILGGDQAAALRHLARAGEGARAGDAWPCSSG